MKRAGGEGANLGFSHFFGVAFAVKENEAPDPFDIGIFGALGGVFMVNP